MDNSKIGNTLLNVSLLDHQMANVSINKRGSFYDPFESSIIIRNKMVNSSI